MATVNVTADNFRLDDADDIGGVSSRGGGAGAASEAPLAYQGLYAWNRKVTSSTGAGFEYSPVSDGKSTQDLTVTDRRHWMAKHAVSDFPGLRGNDGLRLYMGDGTNEYAFITAGTDAIKNAYNNYLLRTATIIIPISPNISGYRDATHSSGTPSLTAVDGFAIEAEFASPSAKSENVGLDAIDIGKGLVLTGGDGVDSDGQWPDFVDYDEGTVNNRFGYANSFYGTSGILFFFGNERIGDSASATVFTDTTSICLWPDGLFEAGFSAIELDCLNSGSAYIEGASHTSLGTTDIEDTRLDYIVTGTAGIATISGLKKNLRNVILTSAATVDNADIECADLTQSGGIIKNSTLRPNSLTNIAMCNDADFANTKLFNSSIIQSGVGHAFEIDSAGTYTLFDLNFSGFGGTPGSNLVASSGASDASIYNSSGGLVTLNISGGNSPSIRNAASSTTAVQNTVTVGIVAKDAITAELISGARAYLTADSGGDLAFGSLILNTLTDSSGVSENTGFSYTNPQPISGKVRRSSTSPRYKSQPVSGIIENTGFNTNVFLIKDE